MVVRCLNEPEYRAILPRVLRLLNAIQRRDGATIEDLRRELRPVAKQSEVARIAAESAERVFMSDRSLRHGGDTRSKLLTHFAGDLIEARALTHARADLLKATGRSYEQHCSWLADLRCSVGRQLEPKVEAIFDRCIKIRRPDRLTRRRRMTLENLNEPIARKSL
jgi:hypothetical protein